MFYVLVIVFEFASGTLGYGTPSYYDTKPKCEQAQQLREEYPAMPPPGERVIGHQSWCLPYNRTQET